MSETSSRVYWLSSVSPRCEVTGEPITDVFVDGRVKHPGQWAIMSVSAHTRYGCGLGRGRGQRYRLQADGRWLKEEG